MATDAVCPKIETADLAGGLEAAIERLKTAESEMVLDFSSVHRLDPDALSVLAKLAGEAHAKSIGVVLCHVPSNVYRVLKLMNLAPRFAFRD